LILVLPLLLLPVWISPRYYVALHASAVRQAPVEMSNGESTSISIERGFNGASIGGYTANLQGRKIRKTTKRDVSRVSARTRRVVLSNSPQREGIH
jgi:hypothetical protein